MCLDPGGGGGGGGGGGLEEPSLGGGGLRPVLQFIRSISSFVLLECYSKQRSNEKLLV